MLLKQSINGSKRGFYIEKVWSPLKKIVIFFARRCDIPTHDNVTTKEAHLLLEWRDDFFRCWKVHPNEDFFDALWVLAIDKCEHSPNWLQMLSWIFWKYEGSDWKRFITHRQMPTWKGDK